MVGLKKRVWYVWNSNHGDTIKFTR